MLLPYLSAVASKITKDCRGTGHSAWKAARSLLAQHPVNERQMNERHHGSLVTLDGGKKRTDLNVVGLNETT